MSWKANRTTHGRDSVRSSISSLSSTGSNSIRGKSSKNHIVQDDFFTQTMREYEAEIKKELKKEKKDKVKIVKEKKASSSKIVEINPSNRFNINKDTRKRYIEEEEEENIEENINHFHLDSPTEPVHFSSEEIYQLENTIKSLQNSPVKRNQQPQEIPIGWMSPVGRKSSNNKRNSTIPQISSSRNSNLKSLSSSSSSISNPKMTSRSSLNVSSPSFRSPSPTSKISQSKINNTRNENVQEISSLYDTYLANLKISSPIEGSLIEGIDKQFEEDDDFTSSLDFNSGDSPSIPLTFSTSSSKSYKSLCSSTSPISSFSMPLSSSSVLSQSKFANYIDQINNSLPPTYDPPDKITLVTNKNTDDIEESIKKFYDIPSLSYSSTASSSTSPSTYTYSNLITESFSEELAESKASSTPFSETFSPAFSQSILESLPGAFTSQNNPLKNSLQFAPTTSNYSPSIPHVSSYLNPSYISSSLSNFTTNPVLASITTSASSSSSFPLSSSQENFNNILNEIINEAITKDLPENLIKKLIKESNEFFIYLNNKRTSIINKIKKKLLLYNKKNLINTFNINKVVWNNKEKNNLLNGLSGKVINEVDHVFYQDFNEKNQEKSKKEKKNKSTEESEKECEDLTSSSLHYFNELIDSDSTSSNLPKCHAIISSIVKELKKLEIEAIETEMKAKAAKLARNTEQFDSK